MRSSGGSDAYAAVANLGVAGDHWQVIGVVAPLRGAAVTACDFNWPRPV